MDSPPSERDLLRYQGPNKAEREPCPKHGPSYVVQRGTNRCPVGRKRKQNCI